MSVDHSVDLLCRALSMDAASPPGPTPADRPPAVVAVERGVAWAHRSGGSEVVASPAGPDALLAPLFDAAFDPASASIVDRARHARPAYRGLLCYAAARAVAGETGRPVGRIGVDAAGRWAAALRPDLALLGREAGAADAPVPAARGADAVRVAWAAAAVDAAGEVCGDGPARADARRALLDLVATQRPEGPFLQAGPGDNLESFWFHELQLLHAVAAFGLRTRDEAMLSAARRAAAYHVAETQPDHATNEPWGLPAFACDPDAAVMADQMLHAAGVQQPGRVGGVTLILLADTLYSLRRFRSAG